MTTTQQTNYGVKEIGKLFPSLMKIKRKSLREKVAAVWNEAIITGCGGERWALPQIRPGKITPPARDNHIKIFAHPYFLALQNIPIPKVLKRAVPRRIPP